VHFVRADHVDESIAAIPQDLFQRSMRLAYVDCSLIPSDEATLVNAIAKALRLENQPYELQPAPRQMVPYVQFLDDLGALSLSAGGVLIVVDRADLLLKDRPDQMFDLIEAFLVQFHHWFEAKKPAHLWFQMEHNGIVGTTFRNIETG